MLDFKTWPPAGARVTVLAVLLALAYPVMVLAANQDAKSYDTVTDFAAEGWAFQLGTSLAELKAVGRVRREVVSTVKNRHDQNQVDEIRDLYYNGLYVSAYFPAKDHKRLLLQSVEITSPRFAIKHGLNVGTSLALLKAALGEPNAVDKDVHAYVGEGNTVYFTIKHGVITKVRWTLYLD